MALDRIAQSGLRAQSRVIENVAHNISQLNAREPLLIRTRLQSEASPPSGPGGVRAETEIAPRQTTGPLLSPDLQESFVRDEVDLGQELTNALSARRAFEANLAVERTYRDFFKATLNLGA